MTNLDVCSHAVTRAKIPFFLGGVGFSCDSASLVINLDDCLQHFGTIGAHVGSNWVCYADLRNELLDEL